ncbi:MAG: site-specific integrase [Candidatus Acidiferrales bacterium]
MAGVAKKIGFAVAFKVADGSYPRHAIVFKRNLPWRCKLNADAPEIAIPKDGAFYAVHAKGVNSQKPETRATPLPGNLDAAFDAFRQFEADYQRKLAGVALATEFVANKPTPNGRVTIADSIEKYLLKCKSAGLRRTTIAAYSGALEDFKSSTDKTYVDELEKEDITGVYCSWMRSNVRKNVGNKDGQRNITFNKRMGFVNTWTETFSDHGLLGKDWKLPVVKKQPDKYDAETIQALLKTATPEESIRIRFYIYTGCRDMEVATAEYSDIDVKTCTFHVQAKPHIIVHGESWQPKTGEERFQVLPKEFVKELMERKKHSDNNLIFPTRRSGKVDNDLIQFLKDAAARAGLKGRFTLHRIRRTAISHAIDKFGVRMAMSFAGHSNIQTTNKYAAREDMTHPKMRDEVEASMAELAGI